MFWYISREKNPVELMIEEKGIADIALWKLYDHFVYKKDDTDRCLLMKMEWIEDWQFFWENREVDKIARMQIYSTHKMQLETQERLLSLQNQNGNKN